MSPVTALWEAEATLKASILIIFQGSNLTFEDNSQMASTWSRFTSHKCVSTSPGMCAAQNSHFYLTNNSNMRKCKTAVAINCNK